MISESSADGCAAHGHTLGGLSHPAAAGGRDALLPLARDGEEGGVGYGLCRNPVGHGSGLQILDDGVYHHAVGGWDAPLGIDLYADGLSLLMLAATALVGSGSAFIRRVFPGRRSPRFWPIWLFLLAALNALFLSADLFNLYVTLELMGLAAVALTALSGGRDALGGAMRYLLATLSGSLAYLLGVALLYHAFGSVDIATLAGRVTPVAGSLGRAGTDERRAAAEDGAVSLALLVAARPCQRPVAGERRALGAGDKGFVLYLAALVAHDLRPLSVTAS